MFGDMFKIIKAEPIIILDEFIIGYQRFIVFTVKRTKEEILISRFLQKIFKLKLTWYWFRSYEEMFLLFSQIDIISNSAYIFILIY